MIKRTTEIGIITRGSLTEGVEMKLAPQRSVEDVKAGKFVVIEGEKSRSLDEYPEVYVDKDCRCFCQTCNKYVELKAGDRIPPCCGKLMEVLD